MTKSQRNMSAFVFLGSIGLLIVLFVASRFDLSLAARMVDQNRQFGRIVQNYGTLPQGALIIMALLVLMLPQLRRGYPVMARGASAMLVQSVLHALVFCTALKFLWGRTRPADLLVDVKPFTPFYLPHPGGHGFSFPSGHVAAALVLLPMIYLLFRAKKSGLAILATLITIFWVGATAYGRMLYGAHYLTDVIFSFGTAILFVPLSVVVGDWYLGRFEKEK